MDDLLAKLMYSLLTEKWNLGPNLSLALMNHFGGHIWDTYNAISQLSNKLNNFDPAGVCSASVLMEILDSIESFENKDDKKRVIDMLPCLAINGFVPLEHNPFHDVIVKKLSENNIAGVV